MGHRPRMRPCWAKIILPFFLFLVGQLKHPPPPNPIFCGGVWFFPDLRTLVQVSGGPPTYLPTYLPGTPCGGLHNTAYLPTFTLTRPPGSRDLLPTYLRPPCASRPQVCSERRICVACLLNVGLTRTRVPTATPESMRAQHSSATRLHIRWGTEVFRRVGAYYVVEKHAHYVVRAPSRRSSAARETYLPTHLPRAARGRRTCLPTIYLYMYQAT